VLFITWYTEPRLGLGFLSSPAGIPDVALAPTNLRSPRLTHQRGLFFYQHLFFTLSLPSSIGSCCIIVGPCCIGVKANRLRRRQPQLDRDSTLHFASSPSSIGSGCATDDLAGSIVCAAVGHQ
jgi:hypothetical protein